MAKELTKIEKAIEQMFLEFVKKHYWSREDYISVGHSRADAEYLYSIVLKKARHEIISHLEKI